MQTGHLKYLKILIWQTLLNCEFRELCSSEQSCIINTLAASLTDKSMLSLREAFCFPCTAHLSHLLVVPGWHLCGHERGQDQGNVQPGDSVHVPPATHTSLFSGLTKNEVSFSIFSDIVYYYYMEAVTIVNGINVSDWGRGGIGDKAVTSASRQSQESSPVLDGVYTYAYMAC